MTRLEGRVALITGAGRGIGAEYAKYLAAQGAAVVINDVGGGLHGEGSDASLAEKLAGEIVERGGRAVANHDDVSDWAGSERAVATAIEAFGGLDVLVNNAGILRDRMLVKMSDEEWDAVIRVHLRGHFCMTRHAAAYWRSAKAEERDRTLIHTSSSNGLLGSVGQFNYASAKAAIASMARLSHLELNERYKVRAYAIAPGARTRLTMASPAAAAVVGKEVDGFDQYDPANVAPFVGWLADPTCSAPSGSVFHVYGDTVTRYEPWRAAGTISAGGRAWDLESLDAAAADLFA
ncbi:SDR family oxidoreductase [Pseudonocardia halophobica]|uniref:Short-chain dehydrogenase/reductase n=1 Tax=Pseudonocardia halophobica TaxID=29401 RepID=A0A9W6NUR4_9PSEU|nr:SDR family NAD(P)-dependent oxidoreductase [Pseudonocardia halophobica]GLL10570.1 putative short-chain dehydrogenase/reductase [Pseudonocardia halophobica]